jgi:signal transduction histidine kinase
MTARFGATLRAHLFKRVLILTALISVLSVTILLWVVQGELNSYADDRLAHAARTLTLLTRDERTVDTGHPACVEFGTVECVIRHEDVVAFQESADWRRFALFQGAAPVIAPKDAALAAALPRAIGFRSFVVNGAGWRSFGLKARHGHLLAVVAEPVARRRAMIFDSADRLAPPILLLILCSAVVLWFTLRSGLSALQDLNAALIRRSAQDLTPLDAAAWPLELQQPVTSLNRLFQRLRDAFSHEQRLADQAAHQLRTPLAALKAQTQLLARSASPADRPALLELLGSIDRMVGTINQMLALARLDATVLSRTPVDLVEIVRELITERAPLAARLGMEFSLSGDRQRIVDTDALPVRVALSAVIDNAIEHAASGGLVDISVAARTDGAVITVADRGPGMPEAMHRLLASRAEAPSRGFGLPIIRRAMEILQGEAWFLPGPGGVGLTVEILIPA